jgi:hypothetical protein
MRIKKREKRKERIKETKSSVFWDIMSCSPLKVSRHFGGTCHLHLQVCGIKQETSMKKVSSRMINDHFRQCPGLHLKLYDVSEVDVRPSAAACHLLHAGFLLGLFFDPED